MKRTIKGSISVCHKGLAVCIAWIALIHPAVQIEVKGVVEQDSRYQSLEEVRKAGARNSSYRNQKSRIHVAGTPESDLAAFQAEIESILQDTCYKCHGEKKKKGDFRVDTLDPDFLHGEDVNGWLDVFDVMTLGEMPPEDEEDMADEERSKVIDWLSSEIQLASEIRRSEGDHSSFRRMTRYEYNYALQD
ncbi:MAG: hypothetical protein P8L49_17010, partial [Opitutaceae bacterium]|nr:hypothetical protein [Opitutaceae bacterium]